MKTRTASDWLEWAKKLAHYSNMTWHGQVTGVDYSIAAKLLAEKCEELQVELAEMKLLLKPVLTVNYPEQNDDRE